MSDVLKKPRLKKMTAKQHAVFVASGCDPCCHACGVLLNVGDRYALKVFLPDHPLGGTGMFADIRGTCCPACLKSDRGLPPREVDEFESRVRTWEAKIARGEKPTAPGCFMLPDGTVIA